VEDVCCRKDQADKRYQRHKAHSFNKPLPVFALGFRRLFIAKYEKEEGKNTTAKQGFTAEETFNVQQQGFTAGETFNVQHRHTEVV